MIPRHHYGIEYELPSPLVSGWISKIVGLRERYDRLLDTRALPGHFGLIFYCKGGKDAISTALWPDQQYERIQDLKDTNVRSYQVPDH